MNSLTAHRINPKGSTSLGGDLTDDIRRRLGIATWIVGGAYLLSVIVFSLPGWERDFITRAIAAVMLGLSVSFGVYLRQATTCSRGHLELIGGIYQVSIGFAIAFTEYWYMDRHGHVIPLDTLSWVGVIILLFPFLVPMPLRRSLMFSVITALANPVCLWLAITFNGQTTPAGPVMFSMLMPQVVCVLAAIVPVRVLNRLTEAVTKARQLGSYELVEKLGQGGMG